MTQNRMQDGQLVRCCDCPLGPAGARSAVSFGWSVGANLDPGATIYRSFDGGAFVAYVRPAGCSSWGNGWVPCTHLVGPPLQDGRGGGRIVFLVGTLDDLRPHLKVP